LTLSIRARGIDQPSQHINRLNSGLNSGLNRQFFAGEKISAQKTLRATSQSGEPKAVWLRGSLCASVEGHFHPYNNAVEAS
jgi:hypothetical protein